MAADGAHRAGHAASTASPTSWRSTPTSSPGSTPWTWASRSPRPSTTSPGRCGTSASSPTTSATTWARSCRWTRGHHTYTEYGPAGVVAAISPWNFPLMMATWKIAPAHRLGQHVHHQARRGHPRVGQRPRHGSPLRGRFPPGVLNVLNGFGRPGRVDPHERRRVDRITFTGESTTGRIIMGAAATHLAPVSLELGGKGANIVFDDAEIDNAVHWAGRGDLPQRRPGLSGRVAAVRPRADLRRVPRPVQGAGGGDAVRRPTRPADRVLLPGHPRSTSARSSPTSTPSRSRAARS